jgi:hypothetical protein
MTDKEAISLVQTRICELVKDEQVKALVLKNCTGREEAMKMVANIAIATLYGDHRSCE